MKPRLPRLILCLLPWAAVLGAADSGARELASAIIEYELSTTGPGTTMTGTRSECFIDHGRKSATLEKSTTKTEVFGQKSIEQKEVLTIIDGDTVQTIDLLTKTGTKMDMAAFKMLGVAMAGKMAADGTLPKNLREFVEKNGGKWLPSETVLGRKCDVYELMQVKSWVYKGQVLRLEANAGGVSIKEIAKSFSENVNVPASRFAVPAGIRFETPEGMDSDALSALQGVFPSGSDDANDDDDDGPASTLTFAQFKKAVAKVQMPGHQRMPEITADGDHGLILVGPEENGYTIMAQRAGIGEKFEKGAAGKLSRFTHKGHEAFFAQITDEDGEDMAFILVKYPEYRMGLFVTAKPVTTRQRLMMILSQVEL
ncbi:MAG TPA: hypothetical protein PK879_08385 [Opitutaceae bacterium]|nr:hypothetical protein [Opitutaceae bacterium]